MPNNRYYFWLFAAVLGVVLVGSSPDSGWGVLLGALGSLLIGSALVGAFEAGKMVGKKVGRK